MATAFSSLAVSNVICHTSQQHLAVFQLGFGIFLTLLTSHKTSFSNYWDRTLWWIPLSLVDGTARRILLQEVRSVGLQIPCLILETLMDKTHIFVRMPLGVNQDTRVTPVVCAWEFLARRSGSSSS